MNCALYVGIDAGSSNTKCVVLDQHGEIAGRHVLSTGFDYTLAATAALRSSLEQAGAVRDDVVRCISTGYGRERVAFSDRSVTEITCHARGARQWNPEVRSIIDIGGQDTKVIWINARGKMADYRMNAKCAAATKGW